MDDQTVVHSRHAHSRAAMPGHISYRTSALSNESAGKTGENCSSHGSILEFYRLWLCDIVYAFVSWRPFFTSSKRNCPINLSTIFLLTLLLSLPLIPDYEGSKVIEERFRLQIEKADENKEAVPLGMMVNGLFKEGV